MKVKQVIDHNSFKKVTLFLIQLCCLLLVITVTQAQELHPASIIKKTTKLWGYQDESGKMVIEPRYVYAEDFLS